MQDTWRRLTASEGSEIQLTPDVTLKLVPGEQHAITALTFDVQSLSRLRDVCLANGLLGASSEAEVSLNVKAADGLSMRFRAPRTGAA